MRRWGLVVAISLLIGAAIAVSLNAWVVTVARVQSDSMAPALKAGNLVALSRLGAVERFDVIGFDGRGSFLPRDHTQVTFVKRVIGLPGDRVTCCDPQGQVLVNGTPLPEDYVDAANVDTLKFDVVVPSQKLWVMGDNRIQSTDSRAFLGAPGGGFIPLDRVEGRVVAVLAPPSDLEWWGRAPAPASR